jgi:hypothetical protein
MRAPVPVNDVDTGRPGAYAAIVLVRLSRLLVVVTLCLTVGLHWTVLQSVAWVTMAIKFSQTAPLAEALVKTFDGKNPCQICHLVAEGKKADRQQEAQTPTVKLELFLVSCPVALYPPVSQTPAESRAVLPSSRDHAPSLPPPRAA